MLAIFGAAMLWPLAVHGDVSEGEAIFSKKCHSCHDLPNPEQPPDVGWEEKLKKMAAFAGLNTKQKGEVLAFLQSHSKRAVQTVSLAQDRDLFEEKCSRCHTPQRVFLVKPDDTTLRHIVARMKSFQTGWISDEDAERIINYIDSVFKSQEAGAVASKEAEPKSPSEVFVQVCTGCHTLERIFLKLEKEGRVDWNHVVTRMQSKAPEWIDGQEATQILAFLQSLTPPADDATSPPGPLP